MTNFGVLGCALLAYTTLAVGYATRTPIWQNPDEPAHFNYVAHVAQTGTLPELQPGDWNSELLERLKNGRLEPGDSVAMIRYEAWQPPLYYVLAAPLLRLAPSDILFERVLTLRRFGVVLGGLTLVIAYLAATELVPRGVASAVPVTIAGVPMFTAVSSSVSADPLANLLAAGLVLVMLRWLRTASDGLWLSLGTGALLGLGMVTKLALAIFVPLCLIVVLTRSREKVRNASVMLAAALAVMAPWLAHQVTTYGWSDPLAIERHAAVVGDQPRFGALSPDYAWSFVTITFHSFWAQFGWMAIPAPEWLYWTWGVSLAMAALGPVLHHAVKRPRWVVMADYRWLVIWATVVAAFTALVAYNLTFTQFQGRYLFTALVPIALLLTRGWSVWMPERTQPVAVLVVAWLLVALNAFTFWRVLVPGFASVS